MLSTDAVLLAHRQIASDFADRHTALRNEVQRIKQTAAARGTLTSGMTVEKFSDAIERELHIRAQMAWQALSRVLAAEPVEISPSLAEQLKNEVAAGISLNCADLDQVHNSAQSLMRTANLRPVSVFRDRALEKIGIEIDMTLRAERNRKQSAEQGSVVTNIYQGFGIVQTGQGSSATFNQFGPLERDEIERALSTVDQALGEAVAGGDKASEDARVVVSEIRTEITQVTPNATRIRAGLMAIAQTVQALGSARQAYELLKGAAALVGVHLP